MSPSPLDRSALRAIAAARAVKSVLVAGLAAGASRGHGQAAAHRLDALASPGPDALQGLLHAAANYVAGHNALLVGLLAAMAAIHAAEAWGLWHGRRWASWLVVIGASFLLPLETAAVWQHVSAARLGLLVANLLIVGWMARGLVQEAMSTRLPKRLRQRA